MEEESSWVPQWLLNFGNWLIDTFYSLALTIFELFKDALLIIFDMFLALSVVLLNGIGSTLNSIEVTQYFQMLPPEVQGVMAAIGLGEALGMIITALGIRILLQLIPFTRLGS